MNNISVFWVIFKIDRVYKNTRNFASSVIRFVNMQQDDFKIVFFPKTSYEFFTSFTKTLQKSFYTKEIIIANMTYKKKLPQLYICSN